MVGEVGIGFDRDTLVLLVLLLLTVLLFPHLQRRLRSPAERESENEGSTRSEHDQAQATPQMTPVVHWTPKHTIFLSHSGKQKEFTRFLFNGLNNACYLPFFDASDESLRKGEEWFPTMMDAARQCRVAILVLTDDFFLNSKWPMIELNEFAKAKKGSNPKLRILPLYFGITHEQFNVKKMEWLRAWKKWKVQDKRIDLKEWEKSLSIIKENNPLTLKSGEGWDIFITRVVKAICGLVEPDVKFKVPENPSIQHLSQVSITLNHFSS